MSAAKSCIGVCREQNAFALRGFLLVFGGSKKGESYRGLLVKKRRIEGKDGGYVLLQFSLVCNMKGRRAVILCRRFSGLAHKSQQHSNFTFDLDLPIDVSCVSFNGAWSYLQVPGYVTIAQTLADKLCYLALAGC